jgi:hypothetical protein
MLIFLLPFFPWQYNFIIHYAFKHRIICTVLVRLVTLDRYLLKPYAASSSLSSSDSENVSEISDIEEIKPPRAKRIKSKKPKVQRQSRSSSSIRNTSYERTCKEKWLEEYGIGLVDGKAFCVSCKWQVPNESRKPNKLERHLKSAHRSVYKLSSAAKERVFKNFVPNFAVLVAAIQRHPSHWHNCNVYSKRICPFVNNPWYLRNNLVCTENGGAFRNQRKKLRKLASYTSSNWLQWKKKFQKCVKTVYRLEKYDPLCRLLTLQRDI